jgi:ankyrin repeat protein
VDKAKTTAGCTPLYIAAQNGHAAIVSKLLQHGADKSIRGWNNETPLEAAQRLNHAAVAALLG